MIRARVPHFVRGIHSGHPLRATSAVASAPSPINAAAPPPTTSSSITDATINELAAQPIHPLTLSDLVKSATLPEPSLLVSSSCALPNALARHGRPPLSASALLDSAAFTSSLIPVRLAHRVRSLRRLPYIVVSNPHVARIYATYLRSLETLIAYHGRRFATVEEEARFTRALADLVESHSNTIPVLARGFLECRRYITPDVATQFLDEHLRARIGTRLIAEQHIALHLSSQPHAQDSSTAPEGAAAPPSSYIGVIDTALRPATVLALCEGFVGELAELRYGVRPSVVLRGDPALTLSHVPRHLEYILTELLKNAFRATVENGKEREPVEVTMALARHEAEAGSEDAGEGMASPHVGGGAAGPGDETLTIRIRDRGGGIAPNHLPYIWGYNFTTFNDHQHGSENSGPSGMQNSNMDAFNAISASSATPSTIAGLGYGLPLSRAYAEYFGGSIQLQSLWGWGTDVYLRLKGLRGV